MNIELSENQTSVVLLQRQLRYIMDNNEKYSKNIINVSHAKCLEERFWPIQL